MKKRTKVILATQLASIGMYAATFLFQTRGLKLSGKSDKELWKEKFNPTDPLRTVCINGKTVLVMFNPYSTMLCNRIGMLAFPVQGSRMILVEHSFLTLSEETQNVILAHELGHLVHEDDIKWNYVFDRTWKTLCGQVLDIEQQADAYAVEAYGKDAVIAALKELKHIVYDPIGRRDLTLRTRLIQKL